MTRPVQCNRAAGDLKKKPVSAMAEWRERRAATCQITGHVQSTHTSALVNDDRPTRIVTIGIAEWTVYLQDTARVPGALGRSCLICSSNEVVRRLWHYPAGWYDLSDAELVRLFDGDV